jgi:PST family polysaccharide transporter
MGPVSPPYEAAVSTMTAQAPVTRVQAAKGAMFTGVAQVYRVGLSFLMGIVLARLLTPADFGLVAMVSACVALVTLIQDLGLTQATMQRERLSQAQSSALFWLAAGFSLLLAVVLAACARPIAWFFGEPRLFELTIGFASLVVLGGIQSQHYALLNRELRFKTLARIDALRVTLSLFAGIAVAWLTASYWAIFVVSLVSTLVGLACAWIVSSFRPGRFSFEGEFKQITGVAFGVSGFNLVNYFARNADNLLIGRFYGAEPLGLYDRAYRLLLFPLSQIQVPLGRVMLPVLSRLQSEPERYRNAYAECITLLLAAIHPGLIFVTVFPEIVFTHLLGPHWTPAAEIFRWLGVAGLHQIMTSTVGWLFISQGRGGDFVAGLPWGPVGVAAAYAISDYAIRVPLIWISTGRRGPVTVNDLVAIGFPHLVAAALAGLALVVLGSALQSPSLIQYAGLLPLSYLIYGAAICCFAPKRKILLANVKTATQLIFGGRRKPA